MVEIKFVAFMATARASHRFDHELIMIILNHSFQINTHTNFILIHIARKLEQWARKDFDNHTKYKQNDELNIHRTIWASLKIEKIGKIQDLF